VGVKKTLHRLQGQYYWPKMRAAVTKHVRCCKNCQLVRPKQTAEKAPLGNMQISGYAFEHLEIDVLGGDLQRSKRGNKYVLMLSCRNSGWPFAIPMRNVRSKTITGKLSELFCSIGIPKSPVLDNMPVSMARPYVGPATSTSPGGSVYATSLAIDKVKSSGRGILIRIGLAKPR